MIFLAPALTVLKAVPFIAYFWFIGFLLPLLTLVPLAYLPGSIVLLIWFARTFRTAAAHAEERWKAETQQ